MVGKGEIVVLRVIGMFGLAALAGCGGGGGSPIPLSQYPSSIAEGDCHLLVLCDQFPDQATCLASYPPYMDPTLAQDIDAGKVSYDGAKARTCIDGINAFSACTSSELEARRQLVPTCNTVFTGTVQVGGTCFLSSECAGGGPCNVPQSCAAGQCCAGTCLASTPPLAEGADCSTSLVACAAGTTCIVNDATGAETCEKPPGAGHPCAMGTIDTIGCSSSAYCDPTDGQCKALAATGGPCDPRFDNCANAEDWCDTTTSVCTPPLAVGSPCDPATPSIFCVTYATCDATTNTCVERPAVGAACDPNNPNCLGGTCDPTTSICTLPPAGGACQ